jgi:Tfp pilus assembly protein PilF
MDPDHIQTVLDEASDLLHAGKPADTLRCLDGLEPELLDSEDRIEFVSLRAWALSELNQTGEALGALDPLLSEFPASGRLHGIRGVVLSNADELDAARRELELAVSLDERDEVALANLALVYERLRDFGRAVALYEQALALGADIDWALRRLGAAQAEAGDAAAAKKTLRRYLSLAPEDAEQWLVLAILHSDDEEYQQAFDCYRAAERVDPKSPALRLNWGVTAVRAGQLQRARQQLRHLSRVAPDSSRPRLLRAFIAEEEGDLDAARHCYEEALHRLADVDHDEQAYGFEMAMDFFARQRETERCEELFEQAYQANACHVEVCEAYRELHGEPVAEAYWLSVMIEADMRDGLCTGPRTADDGAERYRRNVQVVARDRDEGLALVMELLQRHGERRPRVLGLVGEEALKDCRLGVYEVEHGCVLLASGRAPRER